MSDEDRVDDLERKLKEKEERIETLEERVESLEAKLEDKIKVRTDPIWKRLGETNKRVTDLENLQKVDALDLEAQLTPLERMLIGQDEPGNVVEQRALCLIQNWDEIASRVAEGKQSAIVGRDPIKEVIERELDVDLSPRLLHRVLNAFEAKDAEHGEGMELLGDKAKVDKTEDGRKRIKIGEPGRVYFTKGKFQEALRERDAGRSMEQKLAENSGDDY